jgi:septin family protein
MTSGSLKGCAAARGAGFRSAKTATKNEPPQHCDFSFRVFRVFRGDTMKSAYELAMERLNKNAPTVKLTAAQKAEIAELESQTAAKIAGREIAMSAEIAKADGDVEKVEELRQNLAHERKKLQAELEEKKEAVRQNKKRG